MAQINDHYQKLRGSYLFAEIAHRVKRYTEAHPEAKIIRLGIGDVTRPLAPAIIEALHRAVDEMSHSETFRGYGPDAYGYEFLREKIAEYDYRKRGVEIGLDEIFVSDGAKSDSANIQEIFSEESVVALTDPVYPVYVDSNAMAGRSGGADESGRYERYVYLASTAENDFIPALPDRPVDLIYLCYPNNPTGAALTGSELKKWVNYARENRAILLFDAAYEAYIQDPEIPHSIYEVAGAREVAIEFRSFSKTAGFTGTRCAFTVVPHEVKGYTRQGEPVSLNSLWYRRQSTKFNGAPYIIQRGAEAVYSEGGQDQVKETIRYYMENARIIREGLEAIGLRVFGARNSPYVWLKTPEGLDSWSFFDQLLNEANVVGTPGSGFGPAGEGYLRLTAFGNREQVEQAVERIRERLTV